MIESYYCAPKTLQHLRTGLIGPHIDAFADALEQQGYASSTVVRYLRAAAHLGRFVQRRGAVLADIDASMMEAFGRHLSHCRCPRSYGGRTSCHLRSGVKLFHQHLVQRGICTIQSVADNQGDEPAVVAAFRDWFRTHRGATEPTLRLYSRGASGLIQALGEDVSQWRAQTLREFLLDHASKRGAETTQRLITSVRAFLRYLGFVGAIRDDLAFAIPAIAHWRLATLPRCLSSEELRRLIAACDGTTSARIRDRAIVLLLSRLGLRAGDIVRMRLTDIDWKSGTLRVMGKGRYQVRLALPQDVGDAVLRYLECRPRVDHSDRIFLRTIAPHGSLASSDGVSNVVKRALERAGIEAPAHGAHLLRHTAATEMLRHGVPLDQVGLVLRHRSIDMTAYYAKVDVSLLKQMAQPWPEVKS